MSIAAPSRSSAPAVDHNGFFALVRDAVHLHLQHERAPHGWEPKLVEDYPRTRQGEFDKPFDVITYKVISSVPANMSASGERRMIAPIQVESRPHPDKARYLESTTGWFEDAVVEFTIHGKSNADANRRVQWFHRVLMTYAFSMHYFKSRGINFFAFEGRLEDAQSNNFGQEVYLRQLRYRIRLQFLARADRKMLEYVTVTALNQNTGEVAASNDFELING